MSVTEVLQGLGEWSLTLRDDTPKEVLDALKSFGHVAIHAGRVDPRVARDSLLRDARYVGVYRRTGNTQTQYALTGPGMAFWLGDEDGKGHTIETPLVLDHPFLTAVPLVLPPSVTAGAISSIGGGNFKYTFQYLSPREALTYLTDTKGAVWKINGDGSVDAGLEGDLFTVVPEAALVRKGAGSDMFMKAFPGTMSTEIDMQDFTTRTVLVANGTEAATVTATADIDPVKNPYKDLFGNPLVLTRMISESDTDATNAPARAQLQQNRFSNPKRAITLSTSTHDLKGDVGVGDYLWVFDPDIGVIDVTNEVQFRGDRLYPMKLRLTEMTWPVTEEMGVAYRDPDGNWFDLTDYIIPETGDSTLVVGGFYRALSGGDGGPVGSRPIADTSVPGVPTWTTPFVHSVYQSDTGDTRAQVQLQWTRPNNVDGTAILDGDHFEIRYRSSSTPIFPSTHAQMAARTHAQLTGTHAQPISYVPGPWQVVRAPWDELSYLLQDLPTNMPYEAEIRAVDAAKPPNAGDWSAVTVFQTSGDTLGPATPAPPSIAAGRLNVQMTHTLGRAEGGTYNLDPDLHHFELHGEYEPLFEPSQATLLGKVLASNAMIISQVPAIGSVPIEDITPVYFKVIAVDHEGNKSNPSAAVQATALLIDNAHISDLSVSKLTAGTVTAAYVHAGWLRIGAGSPGDGIGPAIELTPGSIQAFNPTDGLTFNLDAATGNVKLSGTVTGKGLLLESGLGGKLEVKDAGNVTRLMVRHEEVTIRDSLGNEVFANNTTSDWGITQPNLSSAFYPIGSDAAVQNNNTNGQFFPRYLSGHVINHARVNFGIVTQISGGGAVGSHRVRWYLGHPGNGGNPAGGTLMAQRTGMAGNLSYIDNYFYDWPSNMFGQVVFIAYEVALTAGVNGSDWISATPSHFYGSGN